ncbi:MAG: hypothetical protein ACI9R3_003990 [Verrucomicrobiales bacterium]|jgi:hypothetical protein
MRSLLGKLSLSATLSALFAGALYCVPVPVSGATLMGNHGFQGWGIGYKDIPQINSEISASLQPKTHDFCATRLSWGLELRYDGRIGGLSQPYSTDLEFDLPVDAFDRSTTITFGAALFQMDLPFLSFNKAAATYSFRDSWETRTGTSLVESSPIRLTSIDGEGTLAEIPFDPASLIRENSYDLDWAKLPVDDWNAHSAPQMLSAVVMGYDLNEVPNLEQPSNISAVLGTLSPLELESATEGEGSGKVGIAGLVAMLALGGAALFITLEINRDKFDKYR